MEKTGCCRLKGHKKINFYKIKIGVPDPYGSALDLPLLDPDLEDVLDFAKNTLY